MVGLDPIAERCPMLHGLGGFEVVRIGQGKPRLLRASKISAAQERPSGSRASAVNLENACPREGIEMKYEEAPLWPTGFDSSTANERGAPDSDLGEHHHVASTATTFIGYSLCLS